MIRSIPKANGESTPHHAVNAVATCLLAVFETHRSKRYFATVALFAIILFAPCARAQDPNLPSHDFSAADSIAAHYHGYAVRNLPLLSHLLTKDLPGEVFK
ncbi:MAG TPA: hypothetical protein VGD40_12035, partial [Chryseosolibacter sp.]